MNILRVLSKKGNNNTPVLEDSVSQETCCSGCLALREELRLMDERVTQIELQQKQTIVCRILSKMGLLRQQQPVVAQEFLHWDLVHDADQIQEPSIPMADLPEVLIFCDPGIKDVNIDCIGIRRKLEETDVFSLYPGIPVGTLMRDVGIKLKLIGPGGTRDWINKNRVTTTSDEGNSVTPQVNRTKLAFYLLFCKTTRLQECFALSNEDLDRLRANNECELVFVFLRIEDPTTASNMNIDEDIRRRSAYRNNFDLHGELVEDTIQLFLKRKDRIFIEEHCQFDKMASIITSHCFIGV